MQDNKTPELPEGTDTVIIGASNSGAIETEPQGDDGEGETLVIEDTATVSKKDTKTARRGGARAIPGGTDSQAGLADRFRSGREQIASQAGERARGLVTQGLERTAETLANVSKMVGDTAPGIEERLGEEYGDYARRAAGAIENVANTIAEKDPDELIEDTRNFVRNSPGIALAGAAVVGFVVARLIKSGLATDEDDEA